jgi:hypothetical protein
MKIIAFPLPLEGLCRNMKKQTFRKRGEAVDPHPKALEPDCLSPLLTVTTQSLMGEEIWKLFFE